LADKTWSIQSEAARVVCSFIAPPGLDKDAKRKLFRDVTEAIAAAYKIRDRRDILVFLTEHPIDNAGNNGFIQTENPAFESPVSMPK
jgi:phenylpyruvate tautomerase PptA (4-oxalocrotonate tautomerase family)